MAQAFRIDGTKARLSLTWCSITTVIVMFTFSLVLVWVATSKSGVPIEFSPFGNGAQPLDNIGDGEIKGLVREVNAEPIRGNSSDKSPTEMFRQEVDHEAIGASDLHEIDKWGMDPSQNENETKESEAAKNGDATDLSKKETMDVEIKQEELTEQLPSNKSSLGWNSEQQRKFGIQDEMQHPASANIEPTFNWKLCNTVAGADYIPCLDNVQAIKRLRTTKHYEHRERHCPEVPPTCLVPTPAGYQQSIKWPESRSKIWYSNVPHTKLVDIKGHQNWIKVSGNYFLTFPGGGTQFKRGALHYIDFIEMAKKDITWGKRTRVVLDVGCGVASFGGYLFDRDVLTMSFAPKDEHEAQVQFALERGIPAISAVMGTKRLAFPGNVFDLVHCARCRVPWHIEGGILLLELNRLLRPGGYFVWSATPVYLRGQEDVDIWRAMSSLTKSMCWTMVNKVKDRVNSVGVAVFQKPTHNKCYEERTHSDPPICPENDDRDAAWNVTLQACLHRLPVDYAARGSQWPEMWPQRLEITPYWMSSSAGDFQADYDYWKSTVRDIYENNFHVEWSTVRNVMDMNAIYGGFAAAVQKNNGNALWVMNVVPVNSPDTLPVIYERGLFGVYHDWCESFSTYPRSYDLVHAHNLFSNLEKRCKILPVIVEVDRMLRPQGKLIVKDGINMVHKLITILQTLHWEVLAQHNTEKDAVLFAEKTTWRPDEHESEVNMH